MKLSALLLGSVCCITMNSMAFAQSNIATDTQELSFSSILSTMNVSGESNSIQWQLAPSYGELFGFGIRTTVGGYVSDDFALGAIIDYAEHREEYFANAGLRLSDTMRVVGSVGLLKEQEEFVVGEGREDVRQLEYGLSLKGNYDAGIVRGFEVNAYKTNASSDTDSVETGDLTGVQVVSQLKPSDSTDIRIGAGFERAEWASGETDEGLTLQVLGSHNLSDTLSMNFEAKSAETENVYGLGLAYDMSTAEMRNSVVIVNLMQIEGKHGISDDTRVAINWTIGLGGAGSSADTTVSSMGSLARADLLADVMTRPDFLPERVLARAGNDVCTLSNYVNQIGQWGDDILVGIAFATYQGVLLSDFYATQNATFKLYRVIGEEYVDLGGTVTFDGTLEQTVAPTPSDILPPNYEQVDLYSFSRGSDNLCHRFSWLGNSG